MRGAAGEELHRVKPQRLCCREWFRAADRRRGHGLQPDHVLPGQVQRDTARRQHRQPDGLAAEPLDQARARFDQVLAVIEHQQQRPVAQVSHKRVGGRAAGVGR